MSAPPKIHIERMMYRRAIAVAGVKAMDQGSNLVLGEGEKLAATCKLSQLFVLTDGETSGEQTCKELAAQCAQKRIKLNVIGVGTEWNQFLIKDLAKLSEGDWGYIDVNDAKAADRLFKTEFEALAAAAFLDVEMHLRPMKDIKIKRVRQVVPDIKDLGATEPEERHILAKLGNLERDKATRYILDLT